MEDTAVFLIVTVLVIVALALVCALVGSNLKDWFGPTWETIRSYSTVGLLP